jgi:hypothetical protein
MILLPHEVHVVPMFVVLVPTPKNQKATVTVVPSIARPSARVSSRAQIEVLFAVPSGVCPTY